jgi:hypothetical protein
MLQSRAKELLELDVLELSRNSLYSVNVNFTESTADVDNVIGKVDVQIVAKGKFVQRSLDVWS